MAGLNKFYVAEPMRKAVNLSVTSEATGHPIEHALDRQLFTYWEPTTTGDQVCVLDLQNGMGEMILNAEDRNFSSNSGRWSNVGFDTFTISGGVFTLANTSGFAMATLSHSGFAGMSAGRTYRVTFTASGTSGQIGFTYGTGYISNGTHSIDIVPEVDKDVLEIVTTQTAGCTLDNLSVIDITEANVKGIALWINNYLANFGTSAGVKVEYSNDNSNWTQYFDPDIEDEMTYGGSSDPLRVYISSSAAEPHRYWRITFHDMSEKIQLAQLLLLTAYEPDCYSVYPQTAEEITFRNRKTRTEDDRLSIEVGGNAPTYSFTRNFRFYGATKYAALKAVFLACRGGALPVVFCEGSDYWLCYLVTEVWKAQESDYLFYQVQLEFETLPYVKDGEVI